MQGNRHSRNSTLSIVYWGVSVIWNPVFITQSMKCVRDFQHYKRLSVGYLLNNFTTITT